jgi:hypothetical protein
MLRRISNARVRIGLVRFGNVCPIDQLDFIIFKLSGTMGLTEYGTLRSKQILCLIIACIVTLNNIPWYDFSYASALNMIGPRAPSKWQVDHWQYILYLRGVPADQMEYKESCRRLKLPCAHLLVPHHGP